MKFKKMILGAAVTIHQDEGVDKFKLSYKDGYYQAIYELDSKELLYSR